MQSLARGVGVDFGDHTSSVAIWRSEKLVDGENGTTNATDPIASILQSSTPILEGAEVVINPTTGERGTSSFVNVTRSIESEQTLIEKYLGKGGQESDDSLAVIGDSAKENTEGKKSIATKSTVCLMKQLLIALQKNGTNVDDLKKEFNVHGCELETNSTTEKVKLDLPVIESTVEAEIDSASLATEYKIKSCDVAPSVLVAMLLRKLIVSAEASLNLSLGIAGQKKMEKTEEELKKKERDDRRAKKLAKKAKRGKKGRKGRKAAEVAGTSSTSESDAGSSVLSAAEAKQKAQASLESRTFTTFAVPSQFTTEQETLLKEATKLTGVSNALFIKDHLAVALAYGKDAPSSSGDSDEVNKKETFLVIDIGSLGLTVTLMEREVSTGLLTTRNSYFSEKVNAQKFDNALVEASLKFMTRKLKLESTPLTLESLSRMARSSLLAQCEHAKCVLSAADDTQIHVDSLYKGHDLHMKINRAKFESDCGAVWRTLASEFQVALRSLGCDYAKVSSILLSGASCKIPKVAKCLRDAATNVAPTSAASTKILSDEESYNLHMNQSKLSSTSVQTICSYIDPAEVIALGAACHSGLVSTIALGDENAKSTILSATPTVNSESVLQASIGCVDETGGCLEICKAGTPLPHSGVLNIFPCQDGQTSFGVAVVQGASNGSLLDGFGKGEGHRFLGALVLEKCTLRDRGEGEEEPSDEITGEDEEEEEEEEEQEESPAPVKLEFSIAADGSFKATLKDESCDASSTPLETKVVPECPEDLGNKSGTLSVEGKEDRAYLVTALRTLGQVVTDVLLASVDYEEEDSEALMGQAGEYIKLIGTTRAEICKGVEMKKDSIDALIDQVEEGAEVLEKEWKKVRQSYE
eukprot:g795.t1